MIFVRDTVDKKRPIGRRLANLSPLFMVQMVEGTLSSRQMLCRLRRLGLSVRKSACADSMLIMRHRSCRSWGSMPHH